MTARQKSRRAQLTRVEKQRARAEAAYKKTKSQVWYARMKDLTTKACALAPARLCKSGELNSPKGVPA